MSEANKLVARRFLEDLVNRCDIARLPEFLAPDCAIRGSEGDAYEAARMHIESFHRCYPDMHVTVDGQIAEGDIVVTWWTVRGTHLGDWRGMKATGNKLEMEAVNIQRFRDGRIVEHWGAANAFEAFLAMGAIRLA